MDKRNLNNDEREELLKKNINYFNEGKKKRFFFSSYDFFFSSSGINIGGHYATYNAKWGMELDFFTHYLKNRLSRSPEASENIRYYYSYQRLENLAYFMCRRKYWYATFDFTR